MQKAACCSSLALFLIVGQERVFAFGNAQHQNITAYSVGQFSNLADAFPDIVRFGPTITAWSWGVGGPTNFSPGLKQSVAGFINNTPAEELAHLENPSLLMDYTSGIDGGNFTDFVDISTTANVGLAGRVVGAYRQGLFTNVGATPDSLGAYVWAGAAVHLIEDQASPPHAADIIHGLADQFEGPMYYLGQKTANINNFNRQIPPAVTSAGAPLTVADYYNACLQQTQANLSGGLGFTTVVKGVTYQTWLPNNNPTLVGTYGKNAQLYAGAPPDIIENSAPYPDSPSNGEYGGLLEQPSLSTTAPTYQAFWTQPAPADIYNQNPNGYISNVVTSGAGGSLIASLENGTVFASQSTQAAEYAYNFLIQLSLSLPPILSTFTINNAAAGTTPFIYAGEPNNLALTIAENRISTVTVSLFIDDVPASTQTIVSTGALVTLPAAQSAGGNNVANLFTGPFAWSSQVVPLAATANSQLLLPWMGVVNVPWDGTVNGVPLPNGPHTICAAAQDADGNWATFTSSGGATVLASCQSFNVVTPPQLTMVAGPGYGPQATPVPQQVLYDNFSGISADSPVSLMISNAVQAQFDNSGAETIFEEQSPLNITVQTSGGAVPFVVEN
jgi:hypothetical protein